MSYDIEKKEFVARISAVFANKDRDGVGSLKVTMVAIGTLTGEDLPSQKRFKTVIKPYRFDDETEEHSHARFITAVNAFRGCLGLEPIETSGSIRILEQTQREFVALKQQRASMNALVFGRVNPELKTETFAGQTMIYQYINGVWWKYDFRPLLNQED